MDKLQEAINTFDRWVSAARAGVAMATYGELSRTQDGQKQILADAKAGNTVAADFLFIALKPVIAKAFWKYFLGPNPATHQFKISQGADEDFASLAYEMLLGQGETSPFITFNAGKFSKTANLIKQFGYYVYRYLQNESAKIHRTDKLSGMTGNLKSDAGDVHVGSYETLTDPESGSGREPATSGSFTDDIDEKETIRVFLDHLGELRPIYRDVFKLRLKGKSVEETAEALGITGQSVRNHMKNIHALYKEFIGE